MGEVATKTCRLCSAVKPATEFYAARENRDGRRNECKQCAHGRKREWNAANPHRRAAHDRAKALRRRYGIEVGEYERLVAAQGGRCAVCRSELVTRSKRPHVDHDHVTGRVRGILCPRCNLGLAYLEDEAWLSAASYYLAEGMGRT